MTTSLQHCGPNSANERSRTLPSLLEIHCQRKYSQPTEFRALLKRCLFTDFLLRVALGARAPSGIAIVSCPSDCLSVCLSVTLWYREEMGWNSSKLITRIISSDLHYIWKMKMKMKVFAPRSHNAGNLVQEEHL